MNNITPQLPESSDSAPSEFFPHPEPPPEKKVKKKGLIGIFASLGLLLVKFFSILKLVLIPLLKFKFLLSIIINIALYAWLFSRTMGVFFGIAFAIGFVALIFVHEMGHLIAARIEKVSATAPFFIPFMGAAIFLKENPLDAKSEAIIGIGGPITGTLGAIVVFCLAIIAPDKNLSLFLMVLAYYGFFINLFNMIPFSPLDGGRVLGAVSKWFNVIGLGIIVLLLLTGVLKSIILYLILALGVYGVYKRFRTPEHSGYYQTPIRSKAIIAISYFALLGIILAGYSYTEILIKAAGGLQ